MGQAAATHVSEAFLNSNRYPSGLEAICIGLLDTLSAFATPRELEINEREHFYELCWRANGLERYIRVDRWNGFVDAGVKHGATYRAATSLGVLGADGILRGDLEYYFSAASSVQ